MSGFVNLIALGLAFTFGVFLHSIEIGNVQSCLTITSHYPGHVANWAFTKVLDIEDTIEASNDTYLSCLVNRSGCFIDVPPTEIFNHITLPKYLPIKPSKQEVTALIVYEWTAVPEPHSYAIDYVLVGWILALLLCLLVTGSGCNRIYQQSNFAARRQRRRGLHNGSDSDADSEEEEEEPECIKSGSHMNKQSMMSWVQKMTEVRNMCAAEKKRCRKLQGQVQALKTTLRDRRLRIKSLLRKAVSIKEVNKKLAAEIDYQRSCLNIASAMIELQRAGEAQREYDEWAQRTADMPALRHVLTKKAVEERERMFAEDMRKRDQARSDRRRAVLARLAALKPVTMGEGMFAYTKFVPLDEKDEKEVEESSSDEEKDEKKREANSADRKGEK